MKKLVSIRTLIARINRKLAKESKKLLKYDSELENSGAVIEYDIINLKTN